VINKIQSISQKLKKRNSRSIDRRTSSSGFNSLTDNLCTFLKVYLLRLPRANDVKSGLTKKILRLSAFIFESTSQLYSRLTSTAKRAEIPNPNPSPNANPSFIPDPPPEFAVEVAEERAIAVPLAPAPPIEYPGTLLGPSLAVVEGTMGVMKRSEFVAVCDCEGKVV